MSYDSKCSVALPVAVPSDGLQCVIVGFSNHTRLLFFIMYVTKHLYIICICSSLQNNRYSQTNTVTIIENVVDETKSIVIRYPVTQPHTNISVSP